MSKIRIIKPEHPSIQGVCVLCESRVQTLRSAGKYRAVCWKCHLGRTGRRPKKGRSKGYNYAAFKKCSCELCGFVPTHSCQLDVDHIDGDHKNNAQGNLQTLCANCHRLKTWLNRDWEIKGA